MIALGIDLGSSNLRAAVHGGRGGTLIAFPDGSATIPAVVALGAGTPKVGAAALARATTDPRNAVRLVKAWLGSDHADPSVVRLAQRARREIAPGLRGETLLRVAGRLVAPEEVASHLLAHVADVAMDIAGERPCSLVLTSASGHNPKVRGALRAAAVHAGLEPVEVVSDAVATAVSLLDERLTDELVAVVDVGASGVRATILQTGPRRVRVLGAAEDPNGGGDDIDELLVLAAIEGLTDRYGAFERSDSLLEMLRQSCERAKRSLVTSRAFTATIPFLPVAGGVHSHEIAFGPDIVEALLQEASRRTAAVCSSALAAASVEAAALSAVYAVGGMAEVPAIRARIASALGPIVSRHVEPGGSVALGAARCAAIAAGLTSPIQIIELPGPDAVLADSARRPSTIRPPSLALVDDFASHVADGLPVSGASARRALGPSAIPHGLLAERQERRSQPPGHIVAAEPNGAVRSSVLARASDSPMDREPTHEPVPGDRAEQTGGTAHAWLDAILAVNGVTPSVEAGLAQTLRASAVRTSELLEAGAWALAFETLDTIEATLSARSTGRHLPRFRRDALASLFTLDRLRAFCRDVSVRASPPATMDGVRSALEAFSGDGFLADAIELYERTNVFPLRDALMSYVERHADEHSAEVGAMLARVDAEDGLRLLASLSRASGPNAPSMIAAGLRSAHPMVRLQALTCLNTNRAPVRWETLQPLIDDEVPEIRREALEMIKRRGLTAAGLSLARRIQDARYGELEDWERRLLLEAAASVNRNRAEGLAIAILDDASLFGVGANDDSRTIAAEFLASSESPAALEALERNARRVFRNSSTVRKVSAHAAQAVALRRSTLPPASGQRG